DGKGRPLRDGAGGQSRVAELAEPVGEHRVADPLDGAGESAEADWPTAQGPQHHPGPPLAEQLERTHQRSVGAPARFGVEARLPSSRAAHGNKTSRPEVTSVLEVTWRAIPGRRPRRV